MYNYTYDIMVMKFTKEKIFTPKSVTNPKFLPKMRLNATISGKLK